MEQIDYNLLFFWFVGFSIDDEVWDHWTFSKNRDRLLGGEVARRFLTQVLRPSRPGRAVFDGILPCRRHADRGTSLAQEVPAENEDGPPGGGGRNLSVDFHGEEHRRDTHESKTAKDTLLFKKSRGVASKLAYLGHPLMENHHGLVVDAQVMQATGTTEREAPATMVCALSGTHPMTLGEDKAYDTRDPVDDLRCVNLTPHVAQNTSNRSSAIDGPTTHVECYTVSQRFRERIEECFGWAKTIGDLRKSRFVGREKLDFQFVLTMAAYSLVRMRNLGVVSCRAQRYRRVGPSVRPVYAVIPYDAG